MQFASEATKELDLQIGPRPRAEGRGGGRWREEGEAERGWPIAWRTEEREFGHGEGVGRFL